MRLTATSYIAVTLALLLLSAVGCQKPEDRRIALTQSQWQKVQQTLMEDEPEPEYELDVVFGDTIELIGVDVDGEFAPGQEVEITYYWRALETVEEDWKVFVHFDSEEHRYRQNLDHYPLEAEFDGAYRTYHWKEGHIVPDTQTFTVRDDYPAGEAVFLIGLFRGDTRLPVSNDGEATDDNRAIGPSFEISDGSTASHTAPDTAQRQEAPGQGSPEPQGNRPRQLEDLTPEQRRAIRENLDERLRERAQGGSE